MTVQARVVVLTSIIVSVVAIAALAWFTQERPQQAAWSGQASFDPRRAMQQARALAEGYPDRVVGSPTSRRATTYLVRAFGALGYETSSVPFSMWLKGTRVTGQDVVAYAPGASPESVAVLATMTRRRPRMRLPRTTHRAWAPSSSWLAFCFACRTAGVLSSSQRMVRNGG